PPVAMPARPAEPEPEPQPEPAPRIVLTPPPVASRGAEAVPLAAATAEPVIAPEPRYEPGLMPEMREELEPVQAGKAVVVEQSRFKTRMTHALLWLVSVEERDQY